MKYKCKECGDTFTDITEADHHSYDTHNMEFEDCFIEVQEENLAEVIEDSPEENPSEIDSMTEEELKNLGRAIVTADAYVNGELNETAKTVVTQKLLAQTGRSEDKTAHDKHFREAGTTKTAIKLQYSRLVEDLQDEASIACPICNTLWSKLAEEENMKEDLNKLLKGSQDWTKGMEKSPRQIKKGTSIGIIRLIHIRSTHKNLFKTLQKIGLFKIPASQKFPHVAKDYTDNPESCSKPEELSSDQSTISDNKVFLEQLSLKVKEGFDLTPEERKRMFNLWKGSKETRK